MKLIILSLGFIKLACVVNVSPVATDLMIDVQHQAAHYKIFPLSIHYFVSLFLKLFKIKDIYFVGAEALPRNLLSICIPTPALEAW